MQKLIAFILLVTLTICCCSFAAAASEIPTISVSDISADAGDTVDVEVSLENNPGIVTLSLLVKYDESVLKLTKVTDTGLFPGKTHSSDYKQPYTLYWDNGSSGKDITVEGKIATLTFEIAENAVSKDYKLEISCDSENTINYGLNYVDFAVEGGVITVNGKNAEEGGDNSGSDDGSDDNSGNTGSGGSSGGGSSSSSKKAITILNYKKGEKLAVNVGLTSKIEPDDMVIAALYGENNVLREVEMKSAASKVELEFDSNDGKYIKVYWWNMKRIQPMCESKKTSIE